MPVQHLLGSGWRVGKIAIAFAMMWPADPAWAEEAEAAPPIHALAGQLAAYVQQTQHPATGLPLSFANSTDPKLQHVAFTYDVAVSAIILAHAGQFEAAHRALGTYLKMPLPALGAYQFNTTYDTQRGWPTLEYRVHGGPIFWLVIALMRYAQATGDLEALHKAFNLLDWARTRLPHVEGGVAMSHQDFWAEIMSVENNWVYYAALRLAARLLSDGERRQAFVAERKALYRWLMAQKTNRGPYDPVRALDVYTHPLLVGPEAHLEDGEGMDAASLARWAKAHIAELDALFQVPGSWLYDYTDVKEAHNADRERAGWLEGAEQVSLAYRTWAPWFAQQGETLFAKELMVKALLAHREVLQHAARAGRGLAVPNTDAEAPFKTFQDGWPARPRTEPALNGTNWAYLAEVGYNPFTMELPPSAKR